MNKSVFHVLFLTVVSLYVAPALADDSNPLTRTYEITPTSSAPKINGDLSDECWTAERFSGNFRMSFKVNHHLSGQTRIASTYDERFFYVAFDVDNTRNSGPVGSDNWAAQHVSVGLASPRELTTLIISVGRDGQLRMYPAGYGSKYWHDGDVAFDRLYIDRATKERDGGFFVELRFPLSTLMSPDALAGPWYINFFRGPARGSGEETHTWTGNTNGFFAPEAGRLVGFVPDTDAFNLRGEVLSRSSGPRIQAVSRRIDPFEATIRAVVIHDGRKVLEEAQPFTLQADDPEVLDIDLSPGMTPAMIYVSLHDAKGPLWVSGPVEYHRPRLLNVVLREPAYRNTIYSSMPIKRIVVQWDQPSGARPIPNADVEVILLDDQGRTLAAERVGIGAGEYVLDASGLEPGTYDMLVIPRALDLPTWHERWDTAARSYTIRVLKPAEREVYLDGDGVMIVDGEPMFYFGLYWFSEWGITRKINPENKRLGLPPVTVSQMMQGYRDRGYDGGPTPPGPPPTEAFMVEAEKHGLYPIPDMAQLFVGHHDKIDQLKGKKNVLLWYASDEMSGARLEVGKRAYQAMLTIDPYHPICCSNGGSDSHLTDFVQGVDIVVTGGYPVGDNTNMHYREGALLSYLYEIYRRTVSRTPLGKTVWAIPQAFAASSFTGLPSAREYRNLCYQPLAAGARGLLAYSYCSSETHEPRGHYWLPGTPLWDQVGPINKEIKRLSFLWTAPEGEYWQSNDGRVVIVQRVTPKGTVRLVVNRSYDPVNYAFDLPEGFSGAMDLISGTDPSVTDRQISDEIDSLDVRAYLFTR